jgi:hypothetical protein
MLKRLGRPAQADEKLLVRARWEREDPDKDDALDALAGETKRETCRLAAVYAAREGRTRLVEDTRGWRTGRACSVEEWQADESGWVTVRGRRGRRPGPEMAGVADEVEIRQEGVNPVFHRFLAVSILLTTRAGPCSCKQCSYSCRMCLVP